MTKETTTDVPPPPRTEQNGIAKQNLTNRKWMF